MFGRGKTDRWERPGVDEAERAVCAVCATPLYRIESVGWMHELGIRDRVRAGCRIPWPAPPETDRPGSPPCGTPPPPSSR